MDLITRIENLLSWLWVPVALRPIGAFLVLLGGAYAIFFVVMRIAVLRRWISRSTAAFWIFLSPWLAGFLVFTAGPMIFSAVLSLFRWDMLSDPVFAGFGNYQQAAADPLLFQAIKV
jgi:multiple sugar transport system permease protein